MNFTYISSFIANKMLKINNLSYFEKFRFSNFA